MSNVALHMFPDVVTCAVFAQVARLVRAGGLFVFHVKAYLRELLAGWQQVQLVPVAVPHRKTGAPFKHVWRGTARR